MHVPVRKNQQPSSMLPFRRVMRLRRLGFRGQCPSSCSAIWRTVRRPVWTGTDTCAARRCGYGVGRVGSRPVLPTFSINCPGSASTRSVRSMGSRERPLGSRRASPSPVSRLRRPDSARICAGMPETGHPLVEFIESSQQRREFSGLFQGREIRYARAGIAYTVQSYEQGCGTHILSTASADCRRGLCPRGNSSGRLRSDPEPFRSR